MYQLYLEKAEEPETELSISVVSEKKQGDSRKPSVLTMVEYLTVWSQQTVENS